MKGFGFSATGVAEIRAFMPLDYQAGKREGPLGRKREANSHQEKNFCGKVVHQTFPHFSLKSVSVIYRLF
ncbi:MAG TPA: hypothetical protein VNO70_17035 [Blastocatellia bacterium]|nr:hypothetical protein [Blastocatellia bacterium]